MPYRSTLYRTELKVFPLDVRRAETVLRLVSMRESSPEGDFLLVKHPRPFNAEIDPVYYRLQGAWVPFDSDASSEDWCFLDDEQLSTPGSFIEYCEFLFENNDYCDDIIVPALSSQFVHWFDTNNSKTITKTNIDPFVKPLQDYGILFIAGGACRTVIYSETGMWAQDKVGWRFTTKQSMRDELQTAATERLAAEHLRQSHKFRDQPIRADLERHLAFAYGSAFRVIPTFEEYIDTRLPGMLTWQQGEELLAVHASAYFYCNSAKEAAVLVTESKSQTYIRSFGNWINADLSLDVRWTKQKVSISELREAVRWWDAIGSTLPEVPVPGFPDSADIAFVTPDDPHEYEDPALTHLVRGGMAEGTGHVRTCHAWIREKLSVLDWENHMPADEGDMRPWGGEYLLRLDPDEAVAAVRFWDQGNYPQTRSVHLSDFRQWLGDQSPPWAD